MRISGTNALLFGILTRLSLYSFAATIQRDTTSSRILSTASNASSIVQPKNSLALCGLCRGSTVIQGPPDEGETEDSRRYHIETTYVNFYNWVQTFEGHGPWRDTTRSQMPHTETRLLPLRSDRLGGIRGGWIHEMFRDEEHGGPHVWRTTFRADRDGFDALELWWRRTHWRAASRIIVIWHVETVSTKVTSRPFPLGGR